MSSGCTASRLDVYIIYEAIPPVSLVPPGIRSVEFLLSPLFPLLNWVLACTLLGNTSTATFLSFVPLPLSSMLNGRACHLKTMWKAVLHRAEADKPAHRPQGRRGAQTGEAGAARCFLKTGTGCRRYGVTENYGMGACQAAISRWSRKVDGLGVGARSLRWGGAEVKSVRENLQSPDRKS